VLHSWAILDGLLKNPPKLHPYFENTWGPDEAAELVSGGWIPVGSEVNR